MSRRLGRTLSGILIGGLWGVLCGNVLYFAGASGTKSGAVTAMAARGVPERAAGLLFMLAVALLLLAVGTPIFRWLKRREIV